MLHRHFTTLHRCCTVQCKCNASEPEAVSPPAPLKRSLREVRKRSLGFWKRSERGLLNASQNASQMFHRCPQHVLQTGLFWLLEKLSNRSNRPLLETHSDLFQVSFRSVSHKSIAESSARNRSKKRSERGLKEVWKSRSMNNADDRSGYSISFRPVSDLSGIQSDLFGHCHGIAKCETSRSTSDQHLRSTCVKNSRYLLGTVGTHRGTHPHRIPEWLKSHLI